MNLTDSILQDIRSAVGLERTCVDFDTDLLIYINASIGKLNQNGIGNELILGDDGYTWNDLQSPAQEYANKYFKMVPLFVMMDCKFLFDPPPPSSVQYHQRAIDEMLWRLKIAYEQPPTTATTQC